jgi:integrase/recombinase XerC
VDADADGQTTEIETEFLPAIAGEARGTIAAIAAGLDLLTAVLAGRNAQTARAYRSDYQDFAKFLGAESPSSAINELLAQRQGTANACVLAYRAHLADRKLAAATIGRRLAALRAAVKLGRQLGMVAWQLEVESPRSTGYRDTSGPGREGWKSVVESAIAAATTPKGRRDLSLARLMHDLALRRAEAVGLDLADVDLTRGTISIIGKGKTEKVPITLPGPTRAALADWIAARGSEPGPLFRRLDNARGAEPGRLSGRGVYDVVGGLGRKAKLSRKLRPHGLRHQGITRALDVTGGDVRSVRRFSRHAKVETLMVYDDNRQDLAGDVACAVAED